MEKHIDLLEYLEVRSISVDNNSNIYIGGEHRGRIDFNPDPVLEHVYNSVSSSIDGFVLKLDSLGQFKWV